MQTHSQRLETWLGAEKVARLSDSMLDWYGPPIALMGVPGNVYACGGGGFSGRIQAGSEVSAIERAEDLLNRSERARRLLFGIRRKQSGGFASLTELQTEAANGKRREFPLNKAAPAAATAFIPISYWSLAGLPPAGSASGAAPGGTVCNGSTTGTFPLDSVSSETRHFISGFIRSDFAQNSMLLYDRLFGVAKTMNDTSTEAVTGVPTRYTSQTATDPDYIGGNFLFVEVGTTSLAATAHDWTVCTYTDQGGNASTAPAMSGRASAAARSFDQPTGYWFFPLEAGDTGIKALTQMQCSAAVATGLIDFVIGHPIAFLPCVIGHLITLTDGINTSFNFARVFDDACLAWAMMMPGSGNPSVVTGSVTLVHS